MFTVMKVEYKRKFTCIKKLAAHLLQACKRLAKLATCNPQASKRLAEPDTSLWDFLIHICINEEDVSFVLTSLPLVDYLKACCKLARSRFIQVKFRLYSICKLKGILSLFYYNNSTSFMIHH